MRNLRNYSCKAGGELPPPTENPGWITGFVDGEGSFGIQLVRSSSTRLGWAVGLTFSIGLHLKDRIVLEHIRTYFGVGDISCSSDVVRFRIRTIDGSNVIIKHFDKHPLITQKLYDYLLWRQVLIMINGKEHLTEEGLKKIVAIKAAINLGLSDKLREAFPYVTPVNRMPPLVPGRVGSPPVPKTLDPYWLAGFTSGEGCFSVSIVKSRNIELIRLRFYLSQHTRDEELMKSLTEYFNCGFYRKNGDRPSGFFAVDKFSDLNEKIIPFFKKYCIFGVKKLDFQDFCIAAKLMEKKQHLTPEGRDQIRRIRAGMNKFRVIQVK